MSFAHLERELEGVFARGVDAPLSDQSFNELALRVFAHQFTECPPYRTFCEGRRATPDTLERWQDVPTVPATAFKHLDLVSGDRHTVDHVFRTSGTTRGAELRGRHLVRSGSLYRASLLPNFRAHLLPDGESLPLLSLVPSPTHAPESSLSAMVGAVATHCAESVSWLVDAEGVPDPPRFLDVVRGLEEQGRAALVVGTAFAFVHLLDALADSSETVAFPQGSRLMETGGFKGRSRDVGRQALYSSIVERLGIPLHRIVNEYGMTELLSQLYEPVLIEGRDRDRYHRPPPWLRVRALEPTTLEELPEGEPGLLAFFDLANLGSVSHILTEDVGAGVKGGIRLQGRVAGAEPRGCSLAMEEILSAVGNRS